MKAFRFIQNNKWFFLACAIAIGVGYAAADNYLSSWLSAPFSWSMRTANIIPTGPVRLTAEQREKLITRLGELGFNTPYNPYPDKNLPGRTPQYYEIMDLPGYRPRHPEKCPWNKPNVMIDFEACADADESYGTSAEILRLIHPATQHFMMRQEHLVRVLFFMGSDNTPKILIDFTLDGQWSPYDEYTVFLNYGALGGVGRAVGLDKPVAPRLYLIDDPFPFDPIDNGNGSVSPPTLALYRKSYGKDTKLLKIAFENGLERRHLFLATVAGRALKESEKGAPPLDEAKKASERNREKQLADISEEEIKNKSIFGDEADKVIFSTTKEHWPRTTAVRLNNKIYLLVSFNHFHHDDIITGKDQLTFKFEDGGKTTDIVPVKSKDGVFLLPCPCKSSWSGNEILFVYHTQTDHPTARGRYSRANPYTAFRAFQEVVGPLQR